MITLARYKGCKVLSVGSYRKSEWSVALAFFLLNTFIFEGVFYFENFNFKLATLFFSVLPTNLTYFITRQYLITSWGRAVPWSIVHLPASQRSSHAEWDSVSSTNRFILRLHLAFFVKFSHETLIRRLIA